MRITALVCPAALVAAACQAPQPDTVTSSEASVIEAEVRGALAAIPPDLARSGPEAWLPHFDDADFVMASEGGMKFASFAEARAAMEAFGPTIDEMVLVWHDIRVAVHTQHVASFGARYDELLVDKAGQEVHFTGYVTGLLRQTEAGWRIAELHWSMKTPS